MRTGAVPSGAGPGGEEDRRAVVLVLAPAGRDAAIASAILREAGIATTPCADHEALRACLEEAAAAVVTEEALSPDTRELSAWVEAQPPWSDFPFVLLTHRGAGPERDPSAERFTRLLGNVTFLERPFHPTTLASTARAALAARRRQLQARDALIAREAATERLRFALEAGRLGSWELDVDSLELWASDACKAIFGRLPEQPFTYADLCEAIHPHDLPGMQDAVRRALDGGAYEIEYRTLWPDGSGHWAQVRGRAMRTADGRRRMAGVSLDTTRRRAIEEELRRHREELEELVAERTRELEAANVRLRQSAIERERAESALLQAQKMEAIGQLTGGIAHDFNNLLQAILASLDLIRRRAEGSAAIRELAGAGEEAARRGARLTAQLLAFSRSQSLELVPVAVNDLLHGMRDLLARSLGSSVEVCIEAKDVDLCALGDPTQIELALLNLCINARDAMPDGGTVTITTGLAAIDADAELAPGRYVSISVHDVGVGMTPDVSARAFEPFFTTKDVGKGTGLGLSQVYGIARQSGGTARIRNGADRGTVVTILLPAVAPAQGAHAAVIPREVVMDGDQRLVLVADDDSAVRRSLMAWLRTLGYRVAEAEDGHAALAVLGSAAPDVLLVDYAMPGLTGAEVAAEALRRSPGLPIVLATGFAASLHEAAAVEHLVVLKKPFGMEELARAVTRALGRDGV